MCEAFSELKEEQKTMHMEVDAAVKNSCTPKKTAVDEKSLKKKVESKNCNVTGKSSTDDAEKKVSALPKEVHSKEKTGLFF
jgi:hypothetical protein